MASGNCTFERKGNIVTGRCHVVKNGGLTTLEYSLSLKPIRAEVVKALRTRVGWGWSDIKRSVGSIAKRIAKSRIADKLKILASTVVSEGIAKGLPIAATVYPPLGATYGAIRKGVLLIERLKGGDEVAQKKVTDMVLRADMGNPTAEKAMSLLQQIWALKKQAPDATPAQIEGWFFNRPYRSPLAVSVAPSLRSLYFSGMQR